MSDDGRKEVENMSEEQKKLITEVVGNMKHMDKESLLLMKSNAEVLKARDLMDKPEVTAGTEKEGN